MMLANFVIISDSVICLRLLIAFAVRHESTVVFISGHSNSNSHRKKNVNSIGRSTGKNVCHLGNEREKGCSFGELPNQK